MEWVTNGFIIGVTCNWGHVPDLMQKPSNLVVVSLSKTIVQLILTICCPWLDHQERSLNTLQMLQYCNNRWCCTKRHLLEKIRINFTYTSSKSYFQKKKTKQNLSCNIRPPVHTAYPCVLAINMRISHSIIHLLEMRTLLTEKQLCWF